QQGYEPVLEDWVWHGILPTVAYGTLLVSGVVLAGGPSPLFPIAGAVLLLVFIGIHNSWDTVTYITVASPTPRPDANPANAPSNAPTTSATAATSIAPVSPAPSPAGDPPNPPSAPRS